MPASAFCRYVLRTRDVDAARKFYAEALELELPNGTAEGSSLEAWPLHERARARGAPSHWLGQIAVDDLVATERRLLELGAELLGPSVDAGDGARFATFRDPFGAVVGLRAGGRQPDDHPVGWHQLHTRDLERAWALYCDLFGWAHREPIEAPDPEGGHRVFAWSGSDAPVGSMANTARLPGVHAHWLFYLTVADVEAVVARVRALGGTAMSPLELAGAGVLSACEDPQGAAFGLLEKALTTLAE